MRVLNIDLGNKNTESQEIPETLAHKWIGGKGLAGHILRQDATRTWDDPQMPLIFMTGPLVGTPSPTSGRMCIMSRSPLTGTIGDCSVGGEFGTDDYRHLQTEPVKLGQREGGFRWRTCYWTGPGQLVEEGLLEGDDSKLIVDRAIDFIDRQEAAGRPSRSRHSRPASSACTSDTAGVHGVPPSAAPARAGRRSR